MIGAECDACALDRVYEMSRGEVGREQFAVVRTVPRLSAGKLSRKRSEWLPLIVNGLFQDRSDGDV